MGANILFSCQRILCWKWWPVTSLPGDSLVEAFACDAIRNPSAGLGRDVRSGVRQLQPLSIWQGWDELCQDGATEASRPLFLVALVARGESCPYVWQQVPFLR